MKSDGLVVEGEEGGLGAEDRAKAYSTRNHSESTTEAGRFRLIESMLDRRAREIADREKRLCDREVSTETAIREAESKARAAGAVVLEEASKKAAAIVGAAVDEAGQILQKVNVEASALRQAAQDHLVAGLALADTARLPPPAPPTNGQMLAKLGEAIGNRALSVFERLMLANPEATARLASGIADTFAPGEPKTKGPTFGEVANAAEFLGKPGVAEFLAARGLENFESLMLSDGCLLIEAAVKKQKADGNAGA